MEEKNDLMRELGRIAGKYSNTTYLSLTGDYDLSQVPEKLLGLWYSPTSVSVASLMHCEALTQHDLKSLEAQLHDEFEKLENCN